MEISILVSPASKTFGECMISYDESTPVRYVYDRDDFAHELLNAYRDIYGTDRNAWLKHLSMYLDKSDLDELGIAPEEE